MTPLIRRLDPAADRDAVTDLFRRSADYVRLERGEDPGAALADEFFADAVPGATAADTIKLGLCDAADPTRMLGVVDLGFGYPEPGDAYLGLLLLDAAARGDGLGRFVLRHVEDLARTRGAPRLYIAVLHENPRGRAFWLREGFRIAVDDRPVHIGQKDHLATRMVRDIG
jgi:GNAT superfamily N-acetyltransferase